MFILVLGPQNIKDRIGCEERGGQKIQVKPSDKSHFEANKSEKNEYTPGGGLMCKPFFRPHCTGKIPGLSA